MVRLEEYNILVIDEDPDRAAIVERGLVESGYARVSRIGTSHNLVERIQALAPDIIIIDLENPDRDTLEQMFQVSRAIARPIAMFVDQSDASMIQEAVSAGVSAYVVDGLRQDRIRPIVEMAISRFNVFDQLRRERDEAQAKLNERKMIERAKGLLMKEKGLSEEESYNLLRKNAMKQNRKIYEIAQSVITAFQLEF
ncbi:MULTISPECIES: ANTAR domain-containing protein [Thalassospira]|uniref:Chemotaxis protein CheY n=1 Tax=Thalassospira profundimaris TaxID=502049 RepID=A0A367VMH8_9PROT|nr:MULTISPECIES: ANTAR domain-containing protein [Thalassospira]MBR9899549.1 ANTAR domain-containing protein [Rhodospirillales bacterium]KZB70757.1 two-component system response regulator [Thalassospira sp. MCCC 1A01148]MBC45489.1 two-component system response regulator [Thalassospira sp.]MBO6805690.1 ANTAR domain-containing protein [Thalassospira sp.]MBO6842173.1 ANTAR domain-containing protein [Thalassospira sp.]